MLVTVQGHFDILLQNIAVPHLQTENLKISQNVFFLQKKKLKCLKCFNVVVEKTKNFKCVFCQNKNVMNVHSNHSIK